MTIEALGTDRIGDSIAYTCELARYLAERLERNPIFELKAPVSLNIVCFGIRGKSSEFVRSLVMDIQESGLAAPSWTTINGELVVRCAIVNHRTTMADIDGFIDTVTGYTTFSFSVSFSWLGRSRTAVVNPRIILVSPK